MYFLKKEKKQGWFLKLTQFIQYKNIQSISNFVIIQTADCNKTNKAEKEKKMPTREAIKKVTIEYVIMIIPEGEGSAIIAP